MIIGEMSSKELYLYAHPKMKQAFDFLEECFTHNLESGRYALDGEDVYAMVFHYVPGEKENPRYETHDKYIDIQCMVTGSEFQWYISRKELTGTESTTYNSEKDITFYPFTGSGSKLAMKSGDFAIYFPQDGHLPGISDGTTGECTRIVVKIKC